MRIVGDAPADAVLTSADDAIVNHASILWPDVAFTSNGGHLAWADGPTIATVAEAFADWRLHLSVQIPVPKLLEQPPSAAVALVQPQRRVGLHGLVTAAHALRTAALGPVTVEQCVDWVYGRDVNAARSADTVGVETARLVDSAVALLELQKLGLSDALDWLQGSGWELAAALAEPPSRH